MGNIYTGSNSGKSGLRMNDDADDVYGVNWITVSDGTLANNGNGHVTLTTGGGGGGGVTTLGFGTTGLTPAAATSGVITVAGTLVVANGGTGVITFTEHSVLLGNGTSPIGEVAPLNSGELVIGTIGAPQAGSITSTDGTLTVVNGEGLIDITITNPPPITGTTDGGANRVAIYSGATTLVGDANFTWDGATLTVSGNTAITGNLGVGTDGTNRLGFYGTAGVVQPTVIAPLSPDPGDILASLASLISGLSSLTGMGLINVV